MKSVKSLLAFTAIFGAATSAFADHSSSATIVRLTGSSAFRSPVMTQLFSLFTNTPSTEPKVAYDTGNITSANSAFIWGHIGSTEVILETTFNGSAAGVQAVANNGTLPVGFLPDTLADSGGAATYSPTVTGGANVGATATNNKPADLTMSDVFQSATPFRSPALVDNTVAVVTFQWVTNPGQTATSLSATTTAGSATVALADTSSLVAGMSVFSANIPATTIASVDSSTQITLASPFSGVKAATANATFVAAGANPLTNITPQLAQAVYSAGSASLALFTGNHSDESTNVFALGRNPDSGTRITAFAETGVGINSNVEQYQPTISTGSISTGAVTSQALWPQDQVNGITFTLGNSGYNSGGGLRAPLEATTSAIGGYYLGYLGVSDALTVVGLGGHALSYNGIPFSIANVEEGKYTFWSYEHLMYQNSLASAKKTLANAFVTALQAAPTAGNGSSIKLTDMQVVRLVDGGVVTQNY